DRARRVYGGSREVQRARQGQPSRRVDSRRSRRDRIDARTPRTTNTRTILGGVMGDGYDRFDNEGGSGGGSFVMGLLTGTVLGAGLGMLFAPKAGSELRNQLSEQAGNLANTASEGVRRAQESATQLADRGRELYDKARDAVSRGADEAQPYARCATSPASGRGARSPAPARRRRSTARDPRAAVRPAPVGASHDEGQRSHGGERR